MKTKTTKPGLVMMRTSERGSRSHPLYSTWNNMLFRCYNDKAPTWEHYGGRGIRVHPRWHNFQNFLIDVGERPEGTTLDRPNNDGNYGPDNWRWATKRQQQENKRAKGCDRHGRGWRATIRIDGRQTYLGTYDTEAEASAAYEAARRARADAYV